jgi:phosphoribosylamine-glycine ligase
MTESVFKKFYFYEVAVDAEGDFVTSGGEGLIGVVMGYGATIDKAFEDAYALVRRIHIPEVQYRTDLMEEFSKDFRKLRQLEVAA